MVVNTWQSSWAGGETESWCGQSPGTTTEGCQDVSAVSLAPEEDHA